MGRKAPKTQVAKGQPKKTKVETVKEHPVSMRKSITRMLTSLKHEADPQTKKKKEEGLEDA